MVVALIAVVITSGCASLAMRSARVVEPGEVEVLVTPQVRAGFAIGERVAPQSVMPWAEASIRWGLFQDVDVQLRLDPLLSPELSFGWQLIGDPRRENDVALTLTSGARLQPSLAGLQALPALSAPFQLLADVPFTECLSLTGGVRVLAGIPLEGIGSAFVLAPGAVVGLRLTIADSFIIHPEVALSTIHGFAGDDVKITGFFAVATFGLNLGGTFDLRSK
ncbi:MAG: hypothetical protein Q8O67_34020 [Deltaproteobacteria bacterium]|nr:hypothetical protein [Deltaproteobacteria bacterium]